MRIIVSKRLKELGRGKWNMGDKIDSLTEAAAWLSSQVLPITPMGLKKLLEEVYGESYTIFDKKLMQEIKIIMILRVLRLSRDEIRKYLYLSQNFKQKKFAPASIKEFKHLIRDILWAKDNIKDAFKSLEDHIRLEKEFIDKLDKHERELLEKM